MQRSLIKDTVSNYAVYAVQMAVSIVAIPVYLGAYGETLYGIYLLSLGLAVSSASLEFGAGLSIFRYSMEYLVDGDRPKYAHAAQTCVAITAATAALIVALFAALTYWQGALFNIDVQYRDTAANLFAATGLYTVILLVSKLSQNLLKGAGIFYLRNRLVTFELALRALAVALIYFLQLDIYFLLAFEIGVMAIALAFDIVTVSRHAPQLLGADLLRERTGRPLFRGEVFTYAKEVFLMSVVGLFSQQTDKLVIGFFLDVRFVTVYSVIVKPYAVIKSFFLKTFAVFPPYFTRVNKERGAVALQDFVTRFSLLISAGFTVALLALIPALPVVISSWLGTHAYDDYIVYGQLLVGVFALKTVGTLPTSVLLVTGETNRLLRLETVSAVANIVMSVTLVQYIGVGGVLLATTICMSVSTPYILYWAGRWFRDAGAGQGPALGMRPLFVRLLAGALLVVAGIALSVVLEYAYGGGEGAAPYVSVAVAAAIGLGGLATLARPLVAEFKALQAEYLSAEKAPDRG